jgi:hypothetical protein
MTEYEPVKVERKYPIGKFGRPDKKRRPIRVYRAKLEELSELKWAALRDIQYLNDRIANEVLDEAERKLIDDQLAEARRYLTQYDDYMRQIRTTPYRDARPKKKQREEAYKTPEPYEGP